MTYKSIIVHEKKGYAVIEIDHGKVNAIDLVLLKELNAAFDQLSKNSATNGIILSGRENCFSAGLDIYAMATNDGDYAREFWVNFFGLMKSMVQYPKPLVSAITGYAPAGATMLAILSDYKIMARGPKHVVGLHEFNMGMQIPKLWCHVFAYFIGEAKAWEAVQTAKLFHADEAEEIGLINKAAEPEEVLTLAEKYIKSQINVVPRVYADTKNYFRKELIEIMNFDLEGLVNLQMEQTDTPETKMMIEFFLQGLRAQKKKST